METAAERIRSAVKNILPERPHHLALSLESKYPVPPNFWQHQSPLQYSTFLSDADRGVLLTRPYFDICDEPVAPLSTPQPTPMTGPKKAGNKVSLKDWKNKKTTTSPTENGTPGKMDEKKPSVAASRPEKDGSRKELDKTQEAGLRRETNAQESRSNGDVEKSKSSLPKLTSRDVPSPSSESKKRPLEPDDSARPLKKTKPSEPALSDQLRRPQRPETPSSKEHARSASKDGRTAGSQPPSGSRAGQSSLKDHHRAVSPKVTVNGTRSQTSAPRNSLPPKPDTSGKHLVPPLLSPLRRLPFDEELETASPKKRAADSHGPGRSSNKPPKPEISVKKQKSVTPDLPPLLSPTLPPVIEEALARIKTPSKNDANQPASQSSESPSSARKTRPRVDDVDEETRPKSKIVTMKIKKGSYRKRLQSLLALPSKSSKERSVSVENTPPPAKKRPRPSEADPDPSSSISAKRPKTAEISASKAPYTPPKPATANSLSAPGSSQTQTPGDRIAHTPSAGDAGPPGREGGSQAAKETYKHRWETFSRIGRRLKHKRDGECQTNGAGPTGGGQPKRADIDTNRRAVLTIEMILAYMICFRSGDQRSELSGTPMNVPAWLTLEPHLRELKGMTRHSVPLQALACQLHGTVINEIVRTYGSLGMQNGEVPKLDREVSKGVFHALRSNSRIWTEANELRNKVTDKNLKMPAMGPWTSPHKAATEALSVLVRFAEREHVNWRAEVVVPNEGV
ncbi:hypothetical protein VP1G_07138 [Cytospora mali]|uniref:Uncharacterized protein n=1 Tax=Cytospora mali TaxID=578113 RepID=A0A194V7S2_CYTMA|nr:hypothetical protein VP1G_07138 [Valsa mali var. pyri (nom. inval.)]